MIDRFPRPRTFTHIDGSKSQFSEKVLQHNLEIYSINDFEQMSFKSKSEGQTSIYFVKFGILKFANSRDRAYFRESMFTKNIFRFQTR